MTDTSDHSDQLFGKRIVVTAGISMGLALSFELEQIFLWDLDLGAHGKITINVHRFTPGLGYTAFHGDDWSFSGTIGDVSVTGICDSRLGWIELYRSSDR